VGGDRIVLLLLHRALIRSKIDYGNFTYSSASRSKLSNLNPTHSAGIRLVNGAFRTSRFGSIRAESGGTCFSAITWPGSRHILTTSPTVPYSVRHRYEMTSGHTLPAIFFFLESLRVTLSWVVPYRHVSCLWSAPCRTWKARAPAPLYSQYLMDRLAPPFLRQACI